MKKMRRRLLPGLLCALLLLCLTACGGGSKGTDTDWPMDSNAAQTTSRPAAGSDMPQTPMAPEEEKGWVSNDAADALPEPSAVPDEGSGGGLPADAKVILTADVELETKDFDQASRSLEDAVKELGGWFESRSLNQGGSYRRLSCVIRIPSDQFSAMLERAGQAAHMVSKSEYSEDVSEVYYDSEARLTTQRTKLERLQTLLEQAATMEDIISLENALSETELQIEYLTGSLRRYDSLIGYSTITLQLREVYRLSTDEVVPMSFGQRLGFAFSTGFQQGIEGLENFIIWFASNWMTLLLLAAVVACAVVVLRRIRRRKKAARAVPAVPVKTEQHPASKQEEKKTEGDSSAK